MEIQKTTVPDGLKFKDVNRDKLYLLFHTGFSESVSVESLLTASTKDRTKEKDDENENARYTEEKRQFLSFLMDSSSISMVNILKTIKYDYMNGFLLFLSANNCFHYGFGYFKDKQEIYMEFLENWNSFMNIIVADIVTLPNIMYTTPIVIEINGFFLMTVTKDYIVSIDLNPKWFDRIFKIKKNQYEFRLMVSDKPNEKSIIATGFSDGKGTNSELCTSMKRFNDLIESINRKNRLNIEDWHGQE